MSLSDKGESIGTRCGLNTLEDTFDDYNSIEDPGYPAILKRDMSKKDDLLAHNNPPDRKNIKTIALLELVVPRKIKDSKKALNGKT